MSDEDVSGDIASEFDAVQEELAKLKARVTELEQKAEAAPGAAGLSWVAPLGLGASVAAAISWQQSQSVPWTALHGLLGWAYVLYFWFKH